jgi:hypothetical protein
VEEIHMSYTQNGDNDDQKGEHSQDEQAKNLFVA